MTTRQSAPATKQDLHALEARTRKLVTEEIAASESRMQKHLEEFESRIVRHFDVAVEEMRHDFLGATADKLAVHDDRLDRLERQVGLAV